MIVGWIPKEAFLNKVSVYFCSDKQHSNLRFDQCSTEHLLKVPTFDVSDDNNF